MLNSALALNVVISSPLLVYTTLHFVLRLFGVNYMYTFVVLWHFQVLIRLFNH